jgi:hypothetical protein
MVEEYIRQVWIWGSPGPYIIYWLNIMEYTKQTATSGQ